MSQPPEHPGNPNDPYGGSPNPGDYPPPPGYGPPPGPPPPGYGPPPGPPPGYGPPPGQPQPGYGPPPGYGAPPPPPGYGQPPQPGYPPPPGYQQAPAGYPQYAGGPQYPGGAPVFSVGDAFNWAWNKFSKNAVALLLAMLIYGVGLAVLGAVLWLIAAAAGVALFGGDVAATTSTSYPYGTSTGDTATVAGAGIGFFGTVVVLALLGFVFLAAVTYVQAAFVSGNLAIADGMQVELGTYLRPPRNFGSVILAALLVAVGTVVGFVFCVLPGVIFAFFTAFTIPFVVDRSLPPVDAMKASYSTIKEHFGSALLAYILVVVVQFVGGIIPVIGVLLAFPLSALIVTYTYRRLSGGQVAPMTP